MENYYSKHTTKEEYDTAYAEARAWSIQHPNEPIISVARIFDVFEGSLQKSIYRYKQRHTQPGIRARVSIGGQNKILSTAQEEAILRYCREQWEYGFGASPSMVRAAITNLLQVRLYSSISLHMLTSHIGSNTSSRPSFNSMVLYLAQSTPRPPYSYYKAYGDSANRVTYRGGGKGLV